MEEKRFQDNFFPTRNMDHHTALENINRYGFGLRSERDTPIVVALGITLFCSVT